MTDPPPDRRLPDGVTAYRRTPVFDQASTPKALLRDHATKAGVWGLIRVLDGRMELTTADAPDPDILDPDTPGVVRPEQRHRVTPLGAVRFYVEFYR